MNTSNRLSNTADNRFRPLSSDVTRPRERTQETAQRLSLLALRSWEKAVTGVIAVPAAAALTTGAVVLFTVSIIETTFGLLETTLSEVGKRVGDEFDAHGEPRARDNGASGVS
ncbi:MAG TPA: hypothetical protein VGI39_36720 [Polyangiaceae bacterium]|jgi:hypothetical protein